MTKLKTANLWFSTGSYYLELSPSLFRTERARCGSPWPQGFPFSPGARFSKVLKPFRALKVIHKTPTRLFCEAGLFICCKGNKNVNNCKVSCLETPLFWRYKENYVTRKAPEKLRDFRETGSSPEELSVFGFQICAILKRHCIQHTQRLFCVSLKPGLLGGTTNSPHPD